jgi:hypothetical protein
MSAMPGFTAETSVYRSAGQYQSATLGYSGSSSGVIPQISADLRSAGGPFSGSCGCGPGYCCCILCYFNACYFWCWSNVEVGRF